MLGGRTTSDLVSPFLHHCIPVLHHSTPLNMRFERADMVAHLLRAVFLEVDADHVESHGTIIQGKTADKLTRQGDKFALLRR